MNLLTFEYHSDDNLRYIVCCSFKMDFNYQSWFFMFVPVSIFATDSMEDPLSICSFRIYCDNFRTFKEYQVLFFMLNYLVCSYKTWNLNQISYYTHQCLYCLWHNKSRLDNIMKIFSWHYFQPRGNSNS